MGTGNGDSNTQSLCTVAYARVSTVLNQDPEVQLIPIRQLAAGRGLPLAMEYVDRCKGTKEKRPGLDDLVRDARHGKFKVLIVAGIDRLARNTRHLLNLIHELSGYGVRVISLRENIDFTTPLGKAALTILGAVAELEGELIRERIRVALASKKEAALKAGKEWKCGRPIAAPPEIEAQVRALRAQGKSIREIEKEMGGKISRASVSRVLSQKGRYA